MRYAISLLTLTALLMAAPVRAEVPFLFPVSGVLTDMDDVPLDGDHEVVFTFYNAITGGTVLGGETQSVTFQGGLFHAYIGQETSGGLNVTPFIQTDEIWLGVKVGADSEMSRVRLASVPWAFEAFQCEQVTNLTTAGIQAAIPANACGANAAMRGWSGGSAQCVTLPDTSSFVTHGDIGTAVQAPISQLQSCDYGIAEIDANGTVTCRSVSSTVAACGVGAAGGSANNYLGSDGFCHPAPHACTANQYLDGNGVCQEAPHKCNTGEVLDGSGHCYIPTPVGTIVLWSGATTAIPTGWRLCDGTNGTPNLRNRFIVGAGQTYTVNATGGNDSMTLSVANMPSHTHTMNSAGAHTHTVGQVTIYRMGSDADGGNNLFDQGSGTTRQSITIPSSPNTGSAGAHTHSINATGSGTAFDNRPAYYALAYIMRTSY